MALGKGWDRMSRHMGWESCMGVWVSVTLLFLSGAAIVGVGVVVWATRQVHAH